MIFQREKFEDVYPEIYPIAQNNFAEVEHFQDKIPCNIDIEKMVLTERVAQLLLFTGRYGGDLVAYSIFQLDKGLFSKEISYAINNVFYIKPEFRGRPVIAMVDFCEEQLKNLGVQVIQYTVKAKHDWSSLLERKDFKFIETVWQKWIGEDDE